MLVLIFVMELRMPSVRPDSRA